MKGGSLNLPTRVPLITPQTRQHGGSKAQCGLSSRDEKHLKDRLQKHGRGKPQENPGVFHSVGHLDLTGPQQLENRTQKEISRQGKYNAGSKSHRDNAGEILSCQGILSLAHLPGHHRAAAGTQHDAKGQLQGAEGIGHIDSGQCQRPHQTGDKHAVHNGIKGHKHHHHDVGQRKSNQRAGMKFSCQLVIHAEPPGQRPL